MIEFKKWQDGNCAKHCDQPSSCGECGGIGTKEDVWKAALEWVLSKEYTDDSGGSQIDISEIHKELEHEWYFRSANGVIDPEYYIRD